MQHSVVGNAVEKFTSAFDEKSLNDGVQENLGKKKKKSTKNHTGI